MVGGNQENREIAGLFVIFADKSWFSGLIAPKSWITGIIPG